MTEKPHGRSQDSQQDFRSPLAVGEGIGNPVENTDRSL